MENASFCPGGGAHQDVTGSACRFRDAFRTPRFSARRSAVTVSACRFRFSTRQAPSRQAAPPAAAGGRHFRVLWTLSRPGGSSGAFGIDAAAAAGDTPIPGGARLVLPVRPAGDTPNSDTPNTSRPLPSADGSRGSGLARCRRPTVRIFTWVRLGVGCPWPRGPAGASRAWVIPPHSLLFLLFFPRGRVHHWAQLDLPIMPV